MTPRSKKTLEVDDKEENPQGHAGWIIKDTGDDPMEVLTTSTSPKKRTVISKGDSFSFIFSLVHGDILVFFGDEYEVCSQFSLSCLPLLTFPSSIRSSGMELHFVSSSGCFIWHFADLWLLSVDGIMFRFIKKECVDEIYTCA